MYRQEVNLFKLGRMPLNCVIDRNGNIRFAHYGESMKDIPSNDDLFRVIDELNESSS
jgi:peroxiredoxin Q/BCP